MTAVGRWFGALRRRVGVSVGTVPYRLGGGLGGRDASEMVWGDDALLVSAAWRAVNIISGSIGTLPWIVVRSEGDQQQRARTHPLVRLLNDQPNPDMTGPVFWQTIVAHMLQFGAGYAEIVRGPEGRAIGMWPLSPERVQLEYDERGRVVYRVSAQSGEQAMLSGEDMFVLPGLSHDGLRGYSLYSVARRNISTAMRLDQYTGAYFASAFMPSGVIKLPAGVKVSAETIANIRDRFRRRAGTDGVHAPFIAGDGMDYTPLSHTADQAQMIEARQFTVREIARWLGVPPYLLFAEGDAPRANIEAQSREFRQFSLDPIIAKLEAEVNRKLIVYPGLYRARIDTSEFTRGDTAAQISRWKELRYMGAATVNDVLRAQGMDTIGPEGDVRVMQRQWAPIDPETGGPMAAPEAPAPPEPEMEPDSDAETEADADTDADTETEDADARAG